MLEINDLLPDNPETINDDPYGKGWLVKVRLEKRDELNKLLDAGKYRAVTGE